jgi:ribosomal protein L3 glutamine methyltransferase
VTKEQLFIQLVESLYSENLFFGHAVIDAEDEAMMVLMSVLNESPQQILSTGDKSIDPTVLNRCVAIVEHRVESKKPMAYIIGKVSFAGLEFLCDERALVPRSPIAELILNDFAGLFDISKVKTALDLCTGSGCIGISLAKYYEQIQVDISDISSEALLLAKSNINYHNLKTRVSAFSSDLFKNLFNSYDLILTNPPYVSEKEYMELPQEYMQEPKLGLTTGLDGLKIPLEILTQAPKYLNDGGVLILEVGYSDELLNDSFPAVNFNWIRFANGGQGVCVFNKQMLLECQQHFLDFLTS